MVADVLERTATAPKDPVQSVKPSSATEHWMLDKTAPSQLSKMNA
jgi:hypothetical protein